MDLKKYRSITPLSTLIARKELNSSEYVSIRTPLGIEIIHKEILDEITKSYSNGDLMKLLHIATAPDNEESIYIDFTELLKEYVDT